MRHGHQGFKCSFDNNTVFGFVYGFQNQVSEKVEKPPEETDAEVGAKLGRCYLARFPSKVGPDVKFPEASLKSFVTIHITLSFLGNSKDKVADVKEERVDPELVLRGTLDGGRGL